MKYSFVDGHADTFRNLTLRGGDFYTPDGPDHVTYPRLQQGNVRLQFMAAYTSYAEVPRSTEVALRIIARSLQITDRIVRNREDLLWEGPQVLLTLEGADPLQGDLGLLDAFFRLGVRSVGLTHNHNSCAAGGCDPPDKARLGLTRFGRRLVQAMNDKGMLIDVAHLGRQAFDEVMELSAKPVVNSHVCCAKFVPLERNADDAQLRELALTGGLAAVTFVPKFLTNEERAVTSEDVLRHLTHMVEIAGVDHVAIGSDFDGVGELPTDLNGPHQLGNLTAAMERAGWKTGDIRKVTEENWLRVLNQSLPQEVSGPKRKPLRQDEAPRLIAAPG